MNFWRAVANGETRKVMRQCTPGSPAAAAMRLFGIPGALWAAHAHPGFVPDSLDTITEPQREQARQATLGTVTSGSESYRFALEWNACDRGHTVDEVHGGRWWFLGPSLTAPPWRPRPRCELDRVGELLLGEINEPQTLLRSMASWLGIADPHALTDRYGSEVVAGAVHRSTAYWSRNGTSAAYAHYATHYRVDLASVRAAGGALQRELRLTHDKPW
jgi:hypothetical protein